jgi:RNA polymerase sigma-70 factor (sigma-E family)
MLLSRLYQKITELQGGRLAERYDLAAGLDWYRAWLRKHSEDHAPGDAVEDGRGEMPPDGHDGQGAASVDGELTAGDLTTRDLGAGDLTTRDLGAGDLTAGDLSAGELTARDLTARDLTARDLTAGESGAGELTDGELGDGELGVGVGVGGSPEASVPDPLMASATARAEWSADRAVVELYSAQYRSLVRLAAMLLRDIPSAEEVVQEAFVAMHDGWPRLRDTEKALAYLRQAVVNKARSVLRHRTVVEKNLQKAPPDMPSAEHGAFVLLERSAVVAALRGLPDRQREAIVLRYYADLSEAEIAATMGISRGAVKSHTARGMAALRASLEQE